MTTTARPNRISNTFSNSSRSPSRRPTHNDAYDNRSSPGRNGANSKEWRAPMGSGWDALTVDRWDALATDEQEAVARAIVRGLGDPWTFEGLTAYELGGQRHRIARFFWRD